MIALASLDCLFMIALASLDCLFMIALRFSLTFIYYNNVYSNVQRKCVFMVYVFIACVSGTLEPELFYFILYVRTSPISN
jgi:hypothetical protein